MTIARYAAFIPPHLGGMEQHVKWLSLEQAKRHTVAVFFIQGDTLEEPVITHRLRPFLWSARAPYLWRGFVGSLSGAAAIFRQKRRSKFDLIHMHGDLVEAFIFGLLGKITNVPTVITVHGGIARRPLLAPLFRLSFRQPSRIICVSGQIKNSLVEMGISPQKIVVISSGISYQTLSAARPAAGKPWKTAALFVGRLHPVKGITVLAKAFNELKDQRDLGLVVAGDGPERPVLEQAKRDGAHVQLLGAVSRDKLPAIYKQADMFVMPSVTLSRQVEGTPTSIMEAMAAGLPIIATRTGGIPHLVHDHRDGLLIPAEDAQALAEAILLLARDSKLSKRFGSRGQRKAAGKDWQVIAQRVEQVYREARGRGQ